jgi:hypothetical protein
VFVYQRAFDPKIRSGKEMSNAKLYQNTRCRRRETILPPVEDRIKEDIIWRLSFGDIWEKRRLILCKQHLFVVIDGMNVIAECINMVCLFLIPVLRFCFEQPILTLH